VDWFNPETWKTPAELVSDWRALGGALAVVLVSGWKWGRTAVSWVGSKVSGDKPTATTAPTEPGPDLRFVLNDHR
jgi:hypothetical protein